MSSGLSISLLELNTFGHSICALLIAFLWWDKPLDVSEPTLIKVEGQELEELCAFMCMSSFLEGQEEFSLFRRPGYSFPFKIPEPFWITRAHPKDLAPLADQYCLESVGTRAKREHAVQPPLRTLAGGDHTNGNNAPTESGSARVEGDSGNPNADPLIIGERAEQTSGFLNVNEERNNQGEDANESREAPDVRSRNSPVMHSETVDVHQTEEHESEPSLPEEIRHAEQHASMADNPTGMTEREGQAGERNVEMGNRDNVAEGNRADEDSSDASQSPPLPKGLFPIWEEEMLYGFKLRFLGDPLAPEYFGTLHQNRPYLLLRPTDLIRWKLASQAIERHRWYTHNTYSESFVSIPIWNKEWLNHNLVTLRDPDWIPGFLMIAASSRDLLLYMGMTAACAIYGGMHLLAWNAHFPSTAESILWRLSSVAVAAYGPVYLPNVLYESLGNYLLKRRRRKDQRLEWHWWRDKNIDNGQWYSIVDSVSYYAHRVWIGAYFGGYVPLFFLGRGYLVIECFMNLFHLPESVLQTPNWSQYFPHIN
ncbi:hypothetical protein BCR34DRAFT_593759 [Clohesyomyces aquaticus]|uniref:Uncharacterized protein n=1 Tax=Clohesyomyces aquaticus TaxID=1231657 RepID=A0A1Y1YGB2_9PLEO|nr:hypothetical protein BCR34DRAFT_593759 [Clohesyomyces aquaticus]